MWALRYAAVVVVALLAAGLGLTAWNGSGHDIGPLRAQVSIAPSLSGGTGVAVPPLGNLEFATHGGPLRVRATVTEVRPAQARTLLLASAPALRLAEQVSADARRALLVAGAQAVLVALASGGLAALVVFRSRRAALLGVASVAVVALLSGGAGAATVSREALGEPRFTGLLEQAPALAADVGGFTAYAGRMAELTAGVTRVYQQVADLPEDPGDDAVRLLWVSDIHNNPQAYTVMRQVAEQFTVAAVVDTGDITDLGSAFENRLLARIAEFDVPYVYVRGNHDSSGQTQRYLQTLPNVVVLDDAAVQDVAGLRLAGTGDPLFAPTRRLPSTAETNGRLLQAAGADLARAVSASDRPVDLALVHEPAMAEPLHGVVPLVLTGHAHERRSRVVDGTLELTLGSTGGAGLRSLTEDAPEPLQMSVLHLDPDDGRLLAVDEITLAGLGLRAVTVERRTPESYDDGE